MPPVVLINAVGLTPRLLEHANQQESADRTYLTCWALAFHLMFERRLIGTAAFDGYLKAINTGADPAKAFAALVGQELPAYEKDWHEYLKKLGTDGTVRK